MARQAVQRAGTEPDPETPVGYRRGDVHVTHEGWGLDVPGTYAERRTPEEWWGGGAGRSITLAATQTATHGGAPMPAEMFIEQFATDLGRDALSHRAGAVVGRARLDDGCLVRRGGGGPRGIQRGARLAGMTRATSI